MGYGSLSPWNKFSIKAAAWLKAIRLQFYPMTWIAYATRAYGAGSMGYRFEKSIFWLGYVWLFLVEMATVLTMIISILNQICKTDSIALSQRVRG